MSETPTSTTKPTQPEQATILSDADYAMLKEWEAETSAASRRAVPLDDLIPSTLEGTPIVSLDSKRTPSPRPTIEATADTQRLNRKARFRRTLAIGATGAAVTAGLAGIASFADGDDNSERGDLNPAISSITVTPDANFRLDPKVDDDTTGPNTALHLGAEFTIDTAHDIRVLEDTNNGTWYGIPIDDIEKVVPEAANVNDQDGLLWVNEQGVRSVETEDSAE